MKKMYLMKGMAALAMGLVAASCNKMDFSGKAQISKEDAMANAELQLGATIDPNQDWKMTADATAKITVNETFGETYTVKIYANNPLADEVGYVLKQGEIKNGETFTTDFTYPSGNSSVIVGITDSKGYTFYRAGKVESGVLNIAFGETSAAPRRSMAVPACPDITQPYTEEWVADYLTTASEPNSTNVVHNNNNGYVASCQWYANGGGKLSTLMNNYDWCIYAGSPVTQADKDWYTANVKALIDACNKDWNSNSTAAYTILMKLKEYTGDYNYWNLTVNSEGGYVADENWVTNFKITSSYSGYINVAGSEGITDGGTLSHAERTIVVTGTWNITEDQRIGSLGKIIIANGGTVNVASGKQLNMVNQAQLVILPGGTLTGAGKVEVNNGNAVGKENYNGGTVSVATFNNNFGKFYNYGEFRVNEYWGGAQESNFYNHHLVVIDHAGVTSDAGSTANARIFNACQFYVVHDMRIRNYEGLGGSSLIVDGQLMCSSSEDGTSDPTYVGLAEGAYVECGTLSNNGTSWSGPTEGGYAVVKIGQITYLNWEQDNPAAGGYFANNIYVELTDGTNCPTGNGWSTWTAHYKFFNIVANAFNNGATEIAGNGHVTEVVAGSSEIIPVSEGFVKGSTGCTPGYNGDVPPREEPNNIWSYAFEDTENGDYDMNDVVLKVQENGENIDVWLVAAGATLDLTINLYQYDANNESGNFYGDFVRTLELNGKTEIHKMWDIDAGTMVNTGAGANKKPIRIAQLPKSNYAADKLRFSIVSSAWEVKLAGSGEAPYGVVIPMDWKWPKERVRITSAYNKTNAPETEADQSFSNFMSNAGHAELWYKYPTGSVMIKEFGE
jgi:hypothetical protein